MKQQLIDFWNNRVNTPKGGLYVLLAAILTDILSMNLYRDMPSQELSDFTYFFGQSLATLLYIWTIYIFTKPYFIANLIAVAWVFLAINDTLEELIGTNTWCDWTEILFFGISLGVVILKLQRHCKTNKV